MSFLRQLKFLNAIVKIYFGMCYTDSVLDLNGRDTMSDPIVTIHAVGDVSFTRDIATYVHSRRGGDYTYPLSFVKPELSSADITLVNLETTVRNTSSLPTPTHHDKGPNFSSSSTSLKGLSANGVDIVNLANNHIHDYGDKGLRSTVQMVENAGLMHIGTKMTPVRVINVKGVRLGFVGMSRPFSKLRESDVNVVDPNRIRPWLLQIRELRTIADVVVVSIHWGNEYVLHPNKQQQRLASVFVANGADVILGHHPHVMQTMDTIHTNNRKGTVFYSLGNFLFDSHVKAPGVRNTLILRMVIQKLRTGDVDIKFEYLPCIIHPERGYAPLPSSTQFTTIYPQHVTPKAERLGKYVDCARRAACGVSREPNQIQSKRAHNNH